MPPAGAGAAADHRRDFAAPSATRAAELLDRRGICVRSGYHCAPEAHRSLGTFDEGSLRFSPGWATTEQEIDAAAAAGAEIAAGRG